MGNQLAFIKLKPSQFKNGSVVIITGASSGIGRELAINYAKRNCKILLAARNKNKLEEVKSICNHLGGQSEIIICDVSKEEDCKQLIKRCIELFQRIDILILNAGVNAHSKFKDLKDLNIFKQVMDTNFFGYLYPTKYAYEYLEKSKGQIIVLSSMSGEVGLPDRTAYCSSKFAVNGFFESLRIEMENKNIAITLICPPSVKTPMRDHDLLKTGKLIENQITEIDTRMTVEEAVEIILIAADRRVRKICFPLKSNLALYLKPFFPEIVDQQLKKHSKL